MEENLGIYSKKQREAKIKKEIKRLTEIFKNMETNRKKLVESLIADAAFQKVTLEETRMIINRDGVIEEYQNGANQKGVKKSSAVEVYDKMVNTYSKIIKQLTDLLPERVNWDDIGEEEDDPAAELLEYTARLRR